jgi:hypothetical protein
MCDFIHVLIFVIVSKCRKNPKLTNIMIEAMFACFHTPSAALDDTEEQKASDEDAAIHGILIIIPHRKQV